MGALFEEGLDGGRERASISPPDRDRVEAGGDAPAQGAFSVSGGENVAQTRYAEAA
ncbi:MAG: hypothetical protein U1G07_20410 [Verrucomicrobiota bacterium]